jgi:hypothetical protein
MFMANTQTDNTKYVNPQGNGANSATAEPQKERDQKNNPQYRDSESEDQSTVTNQDSKITNRDEPMRKDPKAQDETNDDEDVDEKGRVEDYKDDHEIDMPTRDPEKTEKKIPNMER